MSIRPVRDPYLLTRAAIPPDPPIPTNLSHFFTHTTHIESDPLLRHLLVLIKGVRILQRAHILRLHPIEQRLDRELDLLARARIRDRIHLLDQRGHMRVRPALTACGADGSLDVGVELSAGRELDEEDDAHVALPLAHLCIIREKWRGV